MNKKYNILVVVLVFLVVLGSLSMLFYINLQDKNKTIEVEATVRMIGDNYIVLEDDNGKEYSITTDEVYNIGDRVDFLIKDCKDGKEYIEGTIIKIDTISKNISFSITDGDKEELGSINNNSSSKEELSTENIKASDEDVVAYFSNLDNKLDTYAKDKSIGDSLKESFITVVDFLFYDGQIKGKTFNELSDKAKIEVLQIALSIDEKIEKYFPKYKETISTKGKDIYTNVKAKVTESYLNIVTDVCDKNSDICDSAKQGLSDLKTNFSLTWDYIKEISGIGITKLKEWYKIWKSC